MLVCSITSKVKASRANSILCLQ